MPPTSDPAGPPMTIPRFVAAKAKGHKLVVLTAYDHAAASLFEQAGVDALLVGDTLGVVVQGMPNTLSVTMDQMVYHVQMVARAARRALVIADMPFLSYQVSVEEAVRNAGRLIKEGGAHCVKLEGGQVRHATIKAIVDAEIPVMGHVGLTPQSIHKLGRYHVQRDAAAVLADAKAVADAGAFSLVLESVPTVLAQQITMAVPIPTIGIGAGPHCDGQVLVWHDAMGWTTDFTPKFVKRFAQLREQLTAGVRQYAAEVRNGQFPDAEHSY